MMTYEDKYLKMFLNPNREVADLFKKAAESYAVGMKRYHELRKRRDKIQIDLEQELEAKDQVIAELEKRPSSYYLSLRAVNYFQKEYMGQESAQLWEWAVSKANAELLTKEGK